MQNDQVPILVKGVTNGDVRINYMRATESTISSSEWGNLSSPDDYSISLNLTGIESDAEYKYQVEFGSGEQSEWFNFNSFPAQNEPGKFSFVFSACVRDKYAPHNVFATISELSPTFVALLGDQMYADYDGDINTGPAASVLAALRAKYNRNFDEYFQTMSSQVPVVAIWDDHDYGRDNSDRTYRYKAEAKKVFKETYPIYPFRVEDGGLDYKFTIAGVDIFVLDTRWYRSPMQDGDIEGKTMLGEEQLSWLLNGLKQSMAPFKLVFSSVSLNDYGGDTSSGRTGFDSWMGYKFERNKILSFIEENQIQGVLVFSGDQHYPSAHILNWQAPLNSVSQTDTSIVYSLSDLGSVVFDFSASPLHYTRAAGHRLLSGNQENPFYSFEVFRKEWSNRSLTSVYGFVEVDTKSSEKSVSVKFYELDSETTRMIELYKITVINANVTDVPTQPSAVPEFYLTTQNYPNPFNGPTIIEYRLAETSEVELVIYDLHGREVVTLLHGIRKAGRHRINWDGTGHGGVQVSSGIYFYRITAFSSQLPSQLFSVTKRMIYLK
ncbi:alkaline phosphatase D family protein [candidate division KSB1 bacterium]|nr:alkaline phosphatase D family protein [candidate division KSB1 bacterium]